MLHDIRCFNEICKICCVKFESMAQIRSTIAKIHGIRRILRRDHVLKASSLLARDLVTDQNHTSMIEVPQQKLSVCDEVPEVPERSTLTFGDTRIPV